MILDKLSHQVANNVVVINFRRQGGEWEGVSKVESSFLREGGKKVLVLQKAGNKDVLIYRDLISIL